MVVRLTPKELRIIEMRYKGLKNKEIAKALDVSEPDVSQTLSRIANKITSVQDTLELMSRIGMIERDVEIELTESGQELLARLRLTRASRLKELKRVSFVSTTPVEELEIVNREKIAGYASLKSTTEKKVGETLKEIAEQLNVLSDQLGGTYNLKTSTQENKLVEQPKKKPSELYIS